MILELVNLFVLAIRAKYLAVIWHESQRKLIVPYSYQLLHSTMYRFISKKTDGTLISYVFSTLLEAYKHCKPQDESLWHRMLYNGVFDKFEHGEQLVLVSWDDPDETNPVTTANYIQFLSEGFTTPFPHLPEPNIHHH